jgi:predicted Rossmann-fold nucleotide-binding protein
MIDRGVGEGFIRARHRHLFTAATTPDAALDAVATWVPASGEQWLSRDQS